MQTLGKNVPGERPRPLYRQIRDQLVQRVASGVWGPGVLVPSEIALAAELGVSQGTVRKALDEMTAENVLVRRQGRGTFVARHGEGKFLFQFFKLRPDADEPEFPQSRVLSVAKIVANAATQERLGGAAHVVHVRRVRLLQGAAKVLEDLCVPAQMFPGLEAMDIPNNLYALYSSRFAVTIGGGTEKLKAMLLGAEDAALLGASPGTPALGIDRVAMSLEGVAVEWRVSLCLTQGIHYVSHLR